MVAVFVRVSPGHRTSRRVVAVAAITPEATKNPIAAALLRSSSDW
jgi:hypothetical protein